MAKQAASKRAPVATSASRKKPARAMEVMPAPSLPTEPTEPTMEPSHDDISRRAFELFLSRGGSDGHDMNDWFAAERQLRSA